MPLGRGPLVSLRFFFIIVVLGVTLFITPSVSGQRAEDVVIGSEVVEITEENYDSLIASGDWMIEFYAPWCGHCKALAPKWEEFAKATKGKLHVGKVDCTKHEELAALFEVDAFPSIFHIRNKELREYGGQRTVEAFTDFALGEGWKKKEARSVPSASDIIPDHVPEFSEVVVLSRGNFSQVTSNGSWFLEFYAPWCGHCKNLAPKWEQLAAALKGKVGVAKIDCTAERLLCMLFDITGYPSIKFLKDGEVRDYKGPRSVRQFIEFTRSGWLMTESSPSPAESLWLKDILFTLYELIEPLATLMMENLGISFATIGILGLLMGFVIGRLTTTVKTRVLVMTPEQWEQLKKAQAEKLQQQQQPKKKKGGKEDDKSKGGPASPTLWSGGIDKSKDGGKKNQKKSPAETKKNK